MSTFTQIYYHITFSSKNREPVFDKARRNEMLKYIWGILDNKKCHLYRINAVDDHVHLLTSVHPTVDLASLIRDIKTSSSAWIQRENIFPAFTHWQDGYGAFTKSNADKERVIAYIKGQEEHHKRVSFADELKQLLTEEGVVFDEKYLL